LIRSGFIGLVVAGALLGGGLVRAQSPERHKLKVDFDYDFSKNPACPPGYQPKTEEKKKKKSKAQPEPPACVDSFNVYDISNGADRTNKHFLFPVPLPEDPVGVKHITWIVPLPNFEPGRHKIAATAHSPDTDDSDPGACWVIVKITPEDLLPVSASGSASSPAAGSQPAGSTPASGKSSAGNSSSSPPQGTQQGPRRPHAPHC
jgi:hypothetical protein